MGKGGQLKQEEGKTKKKVNFSETELFSEKRKQQIRSINTAKQLVGSWWCNYSTHFKGPTHTDVFNARQFWFVYVFTTFYWSNEINSSDNFVSSNMKPERRKQTKHAAW